MLANIQDILVITTPHDQDNFQRLLGTGSQWGLNLSYKIQERPEGIAQAFLIAETFIGQDPVCLILGDNLFYGQSFSAQLQRAVSRVERDGGATIFGYTVKDPERFGVVEIDAAGNIVSIIEKPKIPAPTMLSQVFIFMILTLLRLPKVYIPHPVENLK